jgi:predicted amidohydrolase YtcJ
MGLCEIHQSVALGHCVHGADSSTTRMTTSCVGLTMLEIILTALVSSCVALHASVALAATLAPDTILFNGVIFTSARGRPNVQALAIQGDRIEAIGDSEQIKRLAGPRTKQIDLGGRTVIPGLNDAHMHLEVYPLDVVEMRLEDDDPTWPQVQLALTKRLATSHTNSLLTVTIGPKCFLDSQARRASLDRLSAIRPIELLTDSGHGVILNSAALKAFHIQEDENDPLGGKFERDSQNKLNGVLLEYAVLRLKRDQAKMTRQEDALREIRTFLADAARYGITSLQDMSGEISPEKVVNYLALAPTRIRVRVMRMPLTTRSGRDLNEGRNLPRQPAALISVSGTKWMLDGTPVERPPEVTRQSNDPRNWAFPLTFPPSEITAMLSESLRNEDQLMVHVSGSLSTRSMLDAMDASGGAAVWSLRRVRFEHGDGLLPELIPRAKNLGIVVIINPTHLEVGERATRENLAKLKPFRSLISAGIPVALGSDGPFNPFLNIMLASTFPDRPSEAVSREQAVIAYTRTSAYAEFMEHEKGTLEAGKLADVAVLSQNIFLVSTDELSKTESVLTLVGGKVIYDAHVLQAN